MSNVIHAEPTKDLFIGMLTRDVPINRAILDLIDNCIDGAIRLRGAGNYNGLHVNIKIEDDFFEIKDNCGGIDLKIATEYAFRFGRPSGADKIDNSIGRFGIGMKRSLFKIGDNFKVISHAENNSFFIEVDVDEWKAKTKTIKTEVNSYIVDDWSFEFTIIDNHGEPPESGTTIQVSKIKENIANEFSNSYFIANLDNEISLAHSLTIHQGLSISINNKEVKAIGFNLKASESLKPIIKAINYKYPNIEDEVKIKIFAGIADREINEGGWYIFCNNRLVLDADKTEMTGWRDSEHSLPKYHADFAYFRGYVFFESKDAGLLPWTTTKTGINSDSSVYKKAYFEMTKSMKQVIAILKERRKEKESYDKQEISSKPKDDVIEEAPLVDIFELSEVQNDKFLLLSEAPTREQRVRFVQIQYQKPEEDVRFLKERLNLSTNKEVGEFTFDYYKDLLED